MIIKGKTAVVFDVEVFPNVFTCTVKNTETGKVVYLEISGRKNNLEKIQGLFRCKQYIFVGYNNIHYDNPIINYILTLEPDTDCQKACTGIKKLSDIIIRSESPIEWGQYKYADNFSYVDLLTMLFSQKLRVGLKEMEVTMKFRNVYEYEGDFESYLPYKEIDKMLMYNLNDVEATEELMNRCEKEIRLREGIEKEFNINVLSKDGMTIGTEILKAKYLEKSGKSWYDIKELRSPCDIIDLKDVIFPFIHYDTPILKNFLEEFKQQKVSAGRKAYNKHFLFGGLDVSVGVGGIHTKNDPEIIIPKEDEILVDSDVNSLYPSLIIAYNLVPKHLGDEFLEVYGRIREDRLYAKHHPEIEGNDIKNSTYKLALNGATGNYQNEHSWLYDPIAVMKIRINGQLLLLMLAEKLVSHGAKIKQLNTDGILYLIKKSVDIDSILKEWEEETKLTLETEEYEAFYQFAVNDYLAIGKGYSESKNPKLLKHKGLFIPKVSLGKGMQPMVIPKAINAYFADKVPVDKTVMNDKDINDFITYQKVDKKFSVEYKGDLVQHINRYYVSKTGYGGCLYKCVAKDGKRTDYTNMLKGYDVKIVNNLDDVREFPKDINYNYYIAQAKKIVSQLENRQLSLYDLFETT